MVSLTFKSSCYIITVFDGCLSFEHFVGPSGVPRKNNILEFSNVLYMDINRVKFEKQCRQHILFKGIALTTLVFLFFFLLKKNAGWFGTTADEMGCGSFRGIGKFIILFKSSS